MQDIHVNPVIPAGNKSLFVVPAFDRPANPCQDESAWVDGFDIAARHLKSDCEFRWHHCNQFCSAFDTATSFVLFWFVQRNVKICAGQCDVSVDDEKSYCLGEDAQI